MLKSLLASSLLLASPALGETLLSGAVYFDSENTLREVQTFIKAGDTDGLARLFKGNHISDKVSGNLEVILLFAESDAVEFRFANNPTTYWTYAKYLNTGAVKPVATPAARPSLSPAPNSTLPADLPSSLTSSSVHLPAAMPTPTPAASPTPPPPPPIPTPAPKVRVTTVEDKEEDAQASPSPRRKRYRAKESDEEGVPESAKVWHLVNGHLKWYDKRNWHEVRRALPVVSPLPIASAPTTPSASTATAVPNQPTPVPRAQPVRVGQ